MTSAAQSSIRRSPFQRIPIYRTVYAPGTIGRVPAWLRRLLILLLLALLLLLLLTACHEANKPASLATSALAGPRLTTGPICLEEAVDVSGSMTAYVSERERAERELFSFARRELRPEDLLSVAFFAGSGVVALAPSSMATLTTPPGVPSGVNLSGTLLTPAVESLVAARSGEAQRCASRALLLITDGEFFDDPATLRAALTAANYTRVYAVVPSAAGWGRPAPLNGDVLDAIAVYHFHEGGFAGRAASVLGDAKPLDVIFGEIAGSLTGQRLVRAAQAPDPTAPTRE